MKTMFTLIIMLFVFSAFSQAEQKHARVIELEDRMAAEASMYFERRFPQEPFLVKVDITPLRRTIEAKEKAPELPYFDTEADEMIDEWDNLDLPLYYLRNRIVKVSMDVSVPDSFDDQRLAEIKQELPVYLRLLPYRDVINVERKLKIERLGIPSYVYVLSAGVLLAVLILGFMIRWSAGKVKTAAVPEKAQVPQAPSFSKETVSKSASHGSHGSTEVSGDVTFHDPIKTLEIVHLKINQIKDSGTFPTLKDMVLMDELCARHPVKLGAVILEMPQDWQKSVFASAKDENWLEAFCSTGRMEQHGLTMLETMARNRSYSGRDRHSEDLLIALWRMGEKASTFLKKIEQNHAFVLLSYLPKNFSIRMAKKTFPGAWARLLEEKSSNLVLDGQLVKSYLGTALELHPHFTSKLLEDYKENREILDYLDHISIDDERDIYETIDKASFIHNVRPAFYKVFDLPAEKFSKAVQAFPIEAWALVVINSHRNYVRQVMECFDDKKKVIFSNHLKRFDAGKIIASEQLRWKKELAQFAKELEVKVPEEVILQEAELEEQESA